MSNIIRITLAASALALLAACAGGGTKRGSTPEAQVTARAEARWKHVLALELQQAYEFFTPGYREAHDFKRYETSIENRQLDWTAARVTGVTCDTAERCVASVSIDYTLIGGMPGVENVSATQALDESWLKIGGQWYHLPSRALP
jgi:hypothetical protein